MSRADEDPAADPLQRSSAQGDETPVGSASGQPPHPHEGPREPDEEEVETPFDHPLFLPAVLLGLSLWFLWDGFIVPMEDHLTFNRWGFGVLALATLYFGFRGMQEMRERRAAGDGGRNASRRGDGERPD